MYKATKDPGKTKKLHKKQTKQQKYDIKIKYQGTQKQYSEIPIPTGGSKD